MWKRSGQPHDWRSVTSKSAILPCAPNCCPPGIHPKSDICGRQRGCQKRTGWKRPSCGHSQTSKLARMNAYTVTLAGRESGGPFSNYLFEVSRDVHKVAELSHDYRGDEHRRVVAAASPGMSEMGELRTVRFAIQKREGCHFEVDICESPLASMSRRGFGSFDPARVSATDPIGNYRLPRLRSTPHASFSMIK
jgi:hypothetical protein